MTLAAFLAALAAGQDDWRMGATVTAGGHTFRKLPHGWAAVYEDH